MAGTVGLPPDQIAEAVRAGQQQVAVVEETHDLAGGLDLEEGGEDQVEPALHLLVGVLEHAAQRVAHQPDRQGQGQFAALGLVEQSGGQACFERVQLQLGDQALQTEDQATIGSGRVVNAVLVADEAVAEAAQVEEVIPVGAVAGQAGDVVGEDDADLLLVDQGDEFLKALASLGGAAGAAEVGVDDADLAGVPAGSVGAVLEVILEFKTLLIRQGLMGAGLADVDDGQATRGGSAGWCRRCSWRTSLNRVVKSRTICCFRASGSRCQSRRGERDMGLRTPSSRASRSRRAALVNVVCGAAACVGGEVGGRRRECVGA